MSSATAPSTGPGNNLEAAHRRGQLTILAAGVLGVLVVGWLSGWLGPSPSGFALINEPATGPEAGVPRLRQGLVLTTENRGQVLFGRSCDSCHPGGREGRGADLLSAEFRRDFKTEADIVQLVRGGTCTMPAYNRFILADDDLAQIAKFVLGRAKAAPSATSRPALPALDGPGILKIKCMNCHATLDPPLDPRDVQVLFALDEMAKCAGLTAEQKTVLRTFLRAQQGR